MGAYGWFKRPRAPPDRRMVQWWVAGWRSGTACFVVGDVFSVLVCQKLGNEPKQETLNSMKSTKETFGKVEWHYSDIVFLWSKENKNPLFITSNKTSLEALRDCRQGAGLKTYAGSLDQILAMKERSVESSIRLVYLPTWMADVDGKCRWIYQKILWAKIISTWFLNLN